MSFSTTNRGLKYLPTSNQDASTQSTSGPINADEVIFDNTVTSIPPNDVQGAINYIWSVFSTPINALAVIYSNATSGFPTSNVQGALDALYTMVSGITLPVSMTPTVQGLAYGVQETVAARRNGLGIDVNCGPNSTVLYNRDPLQTIPQRCTTNTSILLQNRVFETASGSAPRVNGSIVSALDLTFTSTQIIDCICQLSSAAFAGTIRDSIATINSGACYNINNSLVTTNGCDVIGTSITGSVIYASNKTTISSGNVTDCLFIGGLTSVNTSEATAAIIIRGAGNGGQALTPGLASCYIGNKLEVAPVIQSAREFRASRYDKFILNALRNTPLSSIAYYDQATNELSSASLAAQTVDRTTRVVGMNSVTGQLFAATANNTVMTKVSRGTNITDALGVCIIPLASYGFVTASDYSITATVSQSVPGHIVSITIVKTSIDATVTIEKCPGGGSSVILSPNTLFDFIISY